MQTFKVESLIPHPQNDFYFDPMEGQKWVEFLESVRTSGVIEPPVVTGGMVIVSGHQRVRACKELGIEEINCEIRVYESEDRILKDLIETNIRQRGNIDSSGLKMGRIINELERIYGVQDGAGRPKKIANNVGNKTQTDIADMLNIENRETYRQSKSLADLPVDFQDMLESGVITSSTAARIIAKLSEEEQIALLQQLPAAQKLTQSQVQTEVDKLKGIYDEQLSTAESLLIHAQEAQSQTPNESLDDDYQRLVDERDKATDDSRTWYEKSEQQRAKVKQLEKEYSDMERRLEKSVRSKEKTVEVVPDKYLKMEDELKQVKDKLEAMAQNTAQRIELALGDLSLMVDGLDENTCERISVSYKGAIIQKSNDLMERLGVVLTYLQGDEHIMEGSTKSNSAMVS